MIHRPSARLLPALLLSALLLTVQQAGTAVPGSPQGFSTARLPGAIALSPTLHPAVPELVEHMWYVPAPAAARSSALVGLAEGVHMLERSGDAAAALPLVSAPELQSADAGPYARKSDQWLG